jgi:hypothetical protein
MVPPCQRLSQLDWAYENPSFSERAGEYLLKLSFRLVGNTVRHIHFCTPSLMFAIGIGPIQRETISTHIVFKPPIRGGTLGAVGCGEAETEFPPGRGDLACTGHKDGGDAGQRIMPLLPGPAASP